MNKVFDYILSAIIILGILYLYGLIIYLSFIYLYYPAYLSVLSDCHAITEVQINNQGYQTGGQFIVTTNGTQKIQIVIPDPKIIRHEQCHQWQYNSFEKSLLSCNNKFDLYFAELQCYVWQYL